jgi:hypothetical protein
MGSSFHAPSMEPEAKPGPDPQKAKVVAQPWLTSLA